MKKQLAVLLSLLLLSTAFLATKAFATSPNTYSDVAIVLAVEDGYSMETETGKKKATPGIQYTIENGSLILQTYYGRGATQIALPRSIGQDKNGPLYMNYIAQGAFLGTGLEAVYLPDCIMMSAKELLAVNADTGEGIYFDAETKVYTFSGSPDLKKMTNVKDLRASEDDDPVIPVNPSEETKTLVSGQSGDFRYTDYGSYVEITGYTGTSLSVTVPSNLAGLPVKAIKGSVFSTKKYDLVQIPTGVSINGQINAKKTVLNYDSNPIVTEEKEYETDAEGHTYTIEDIIVIDESDLSSIEEPTGSGEETQDGTEGTDTTDTTEIASRSGEVTDESKGGTSGEKKDSDVWMYVLIGLGGVAILAGGAVMIKTAVSDKKKKKK